MNPVTTLRLAADILRTSPPATLAPIADDLAAMCDREADHVDEHILAIARHITGEP